jgi:Protein of unknown function (DUF5131)
MAVAHSRIVIAKRSGYPNVWLGTTTEDEKRYRMRWPVLARIPAAIRFISYEPAIGALGYIDLGIGTLPDWIISGGESGPRARTMNAQWVRELRDQQSGSGCKGPERERQGRCATRWSASGGSTQRSGAPSAPPHSRRATCRAEDKTALGSAADPLIGRSAWIGALPASRPCALLRSSSRACQQLPIGRRPGATGRMK